MRGWALLLRLHLLVVLLSRRGHAWMRYALMWPRENQEHARPPQTDPFPHLLNAPPTTKSSGASRVAASLIAGFEGPCIQYHSMPDGSFGVAADGNTHTVSGGVALDGVSI